MIQEENQPETKTPPTPSIPELEPKPEMEPTKKLNWLQRITIKRQLKLLEKRILKEQATTDKQSQEHKNALIKALQEMQPYIDIIETNEQGQERSATTQDLQNKTNDELALLLTGMLTEMRQQI